MSSKPETTFVRAINSKLKTTHCEKMSNPYRSGTADLWYSGEAGDLWVEYKYIPRIPRTKSILPDLSARQKEWLDSRCAEGRNVAVVLGIGRDSAVIYRKGAWNTPLTDDQLQARCITRAQLVSWIFDQTGASKCLLQDSSTQHPK